MSIDEQLQNVFCSVFADCPLPLRDNFGINSIPAWDSVGQLNLVMALEAEFDVEFETDELIELTDVAAIRARLVSET